MITAMFENDRLAGLEDSIEINDSSPDQETLAAIQIKISEGVGVANHVVCIVGYDDNYKKGVGGIGSSYDPLGQKDFTRGLRRDRRL